MVNSIPPTNNQFQDIPFEDLPDCSFNNVQYSTDLKELQSLCPNGICSKDDLEKAKQLINSMLSIIDKSEWVEGVSFLDPGNSEEFRQNVNTTSDSIQKELPNLQAGDISQMIKQCSQCYYWMKNAYYEVDPDGGGIT